MSGQSNHFYHGMPVTGQYDLESPSRFMTGYNQGDSSSTTSSINNRQTLHSYQFIEDYENISPRLLQSANVMHYQNTVARTSLLGEEGRKAPGDRTHTFFNSDPAPIISGPPSGLSETGSEVGSLGVRPQSDQFNFFQLRERETGRGHSGNRLNQSGLSDLLNEPIKTKRFLPSIPSCPQIDSIKTSETEPVSKPSPLKGILVKNKTKSLSSLATRREEELQQSRLSRASLHLPLSSHKVSPCLSVQPPAKPPEEKITYNLYKDMKEDQDQGLMTDGQTSAPESFTLSEVATQTEIHYRFHTVVIY